MAVKLPDCAMRPGSHPSLAPEAGKSGAQRIFSGRQRAVSKLAEKRLFI